MVLIKLGFGAKRTRFETPLEPFSAEVVFARLWGFPKNCSCSEMPLGMWYQIDHLGADGKRCESHASSWASYVPPENSRISAEALEL